MLKIIVSLLKKVFILAVIIYVGGSLFFPGVIRDSVVKPTENIPVVGQVLGVTWEGVSTVGPAITKKTVELSDKVEQTNLPLNEAVEDIAQSENPGEAVSQLVEQTVEKQVQSIKDLPAETVEKIKDEIRQEMYKQVCAGLKEEIEEKDEEQQE